MFVCFSNFYLRHNSMEIREEDFLIRKVCQKFLFWLKLINRAAQKKLFLKPCPSPPTQKVRLLGPSVPVWEE